MNGTPRYASTGRVAKLFVFGREVPLNDGATQTVTTLDDVTTTAVRVRLGEETRDASGYTYRALHVTAPMDGSLLPTVGQLYGGARVVLIRDIPGVRACRGTAATAT